MYFNIIKVIYDKHTTNIILNGKKLKAFPLRLETRSGCARLQFYSTQFWKSQPRQSEKKKKIKRIQIRKEGRPSLLADEMIVYIENPKNVTKTLLELIIRFPDTKLIHSNPLYSYALTMKIQKEKLRNQSHSPLQQKE